MFLAAVKASFFEAAMVIVSPVAGLRPWRSARSVTWKRPNPASVTSSPALAAAKMVANALSGEARTQWEHSIAEMAVTRWSITFRSLSVRGRQPIKSI